MWVHRRKVAGPGLLRPPESSPDSTCNIRNLLQNMSSGDDGLTLQSFLGVPRPSLISIVGQSPSSSAKNRASAGVLAFFASNLVESGMQRDMR
jgi:hypothetical protein